MTGHPASLLPEKNINLIIWTLLSLSPLIGMAVDLISPSLPAITNSLQVSPHIAKFIISIFILGYGFGNFFTGFLTDALGRKQLLRFSLVAFMVISLIPVIFSHIIPMLICRFLQGIFLGSVAVLMRAIISDILPADKLIRLGTLMGTMWGIGPVIGPIIGGYLQFYLGWKAGFYFFSIASLIASVIIFKIIPETHFNRHPLKISTIKHHLYEVMSHRFFMAIVILMGLAYSLLVIFNTVGPFLIQTEFHYSPVFFGHFALWLGVCFLISTFLCRYLLRHYNFEQLFLIVINLFFILACLFLAMSYFYKSNILLTGIGSAVMYFACGFIFPMSMGKGLSLFRHISGTATAAMYLTNMLISSAIGYLVSFVVIENNIPLMWIYFTVLALAAMVYWGMLRRNPIERV